MTAFRVFRDAMGKGPVGPMERALAASFLSASLKLAPFPTPGAPSVVLGGGYWREPWNCAEAWPPRPVENPWEDPDP